MTEGEMKKRIMEKAIEEFKTTNMDHIKVNDTVIRMLAGKIPIKAIVGKVDDDFIYCLPHEEDTNPFSTNIDLTNCWKYDRKTAMEVDEDLGWGPEYGVTGSFITQ